MVSAAVVSLISALLVTRTTLPGSSVYTATKSAADSITQELSKELGPKKIRVNAINPGMVETEGTHTAGFIGSDFQKQVEQQVPLGRIGVPEDIAPIAVFLASDDSGWLIGETLIASGGLALKYIEMNKSIYIMALGAY